MIWANVIQKKLDPLLNRFINYYIKVRGSQIGQVMSWIVYAYSVKNFSTPTNAY